MSIRSGVTVKVDWDAVKAVLTEPQARAAITAAGEQFASVARGFAPHRTGAGAASIHGTLVETDGVISANVSWDRAHYYMAFHESGTKFMPAHPFLQPALDQYAQF